MICHVALKSTVMVTYGNDQSGNKLLSSRVKYTAMHVGNTSTTKGNRVLNDYQGNSICTLHSFHFIILTTMIMILVFECIVCIQRETRIYYCHLCYSVCNY